MNQVCHNFTITWPQKNKQTKKNNYKRKKQKQKNYQSIYEGYEFILPYLKQPIRLKNILTGSLKRGKIPHNQGLVALSVGAVEYTDSFSAEGRDYSPKSILDLVKNQISNYMWGIRQYNEFLNETYGSTHTWDISTTKKSNFKLYRRWDIAIFWPSIKAWLID